MKKILFILLLIFVLISCDIDKLYDTEWKIDKDDINIINKIWKQSIDKAIEMYLSTKTRAS